MTIAVEHIIAVAQQRTGLTDFGDVAIREGLEVLCDALNHEARLTPRGEQSVTATLVDSLANRLRVEDYLRRHPELLKRPVKAPMFVFGLPRTGTTLAINLLNQDPARRCLLRWEAFDSVPPPRIEELHAGPRHAKAQARVEMSLRHAPQISAIHHEDADSPTECQFAMSPSFCAQLYDSMYHVPRYHQWFLAADYLPAFRYHKRLLQLLQAEAKGHWTLKNPWHPLFLDALKSVYPDAQLVMTHRDPVDVVASACSLIKHVRGMFSAQVDLVAIGVFITETFDTMIERMLAYRKAHGWDAIYDLQYADLLADPLGEMRALYARFGAPFTPGLETALAAYLAENPQSKHGRHNYALSDYGLSEGQIRERYAHYCRQFDIPGKA